DPELMLLDEPTAGMGHEDVDRIAALIQRVAKDRTVLMVEHNLGVVASLSQRITVLARGEVLAEGDYQPVSKNPAVVAAYLFPNLRERLRSQGTRLSGGEQQMLAIGRILRTGARLLLLDEPTEGLAPVIVQQIGNVIRKLKVDGFTILLVEQNLRFAGTVAD